MQDVVAQGEVEDSEAEGREDGRLPGVWGSGALQYAAQGAGDEVAVAGELFSQETTAAWLDIHTKAGLVRNELPASEVPSDKPNRAEVHARTSVGNITVTRAA
ncbi:hypothetical protein ACIF6I_36250 [Streptomyces microflavus]|uniref:hypothetical protein n=1 Tax=Streptomyces microflavus TaxID=1919 RepID=UPI0003A636FF